MKKSIYKVIILLTFAITSACSEDSIININNYDYLQEISITGKNFQIEDDTRSSVTISESGVSFTWDEDDVIGIFPNKGDQVSFAMEEGAGTQTASFSGGGWALKSSAKYAAYYPHVYENRDLTAIPVSYIGQNQNGNANTDHIGAYDFMAAGVSTPSNGYVAFDMQHLGSLVQLTITIPKPSTLKKVVLNSSTKFTETGTINLTSESPSIIAETQSNKIEIALDNVTTTEANEKVTVYFMTAPVDLTDSNLSVTVHFANETIREVEITGKNLQAGNAYKLTAEIKANFYLDGVAYLSDAGLLSQLISADDKKAITSLKIVGKINGSDIITLNSMPALKSLDLSETNIVSGGSAYDDDWDDDDEHPLYTANNVIGAQMFWESKLENIVLPTNITSIGKRAFQECKKLTSVTIPSNVTSIGKMAFYGCDELKSVIISGDLKSIGWECFALCKKLETINIPNSVTSIGGSAFEDCSSLKTINIPSLSIIYEYTFKGTAITTVSIPNTVTRIEEDAFGFCEGIKNVTIPNSVTYLSGFSHCDLSEITIPSSVTTIAPHAFAGNVNLSNITIPDEVTSIGYSAFSGCKGLKSIIIPNKVTEIGDQAFYDCSGLTSIKFGEKVRYIGWNAFRSCTGVSTLTLPSSVQTIKDLAFGNMKLTSVTCLANTPPLLDGEPFYQAETNILYVPTGRKESYSTNTDWKSIFKTIIELNY